MSFFSNKKPLLVTGRPMTASKRQGNNKKASTLGCIPPASKHNKGTNVFRRRYDKISILVRVNILCECEFSSSQHVSSKDCDIEDEKSDDSDDCFHITHLLRAFSLYERKGTEKSGLAALRNLVRSYTEPEDVVDEDIEKLLQYMEHRDEGLQEMAVRAIRQACLKENNALKLLYHDGLPLLLKNLGKELSQEFLESTLLAINEVLQHKGLQELWQHAMKKHGAYSTILMHTHKDYPYSVRLAAITTLSTLAGYKEFALVMVNSHLKQIAALKKVSADFGEMYSRLVVNLLPFADNKSVVELAGDAIPSCAQTLKVGSCSSQQQCLSVLTCIATHPLGLKHLIQTQAIVFITSALCSSECSAVQAAAAHALAAAFSCPDPVLQQDVMLQVEKHFYDKKLPVTNLAGVKSHDEGKSAHSMDRRLMKGLETLLIVILSAVRKIADIQVNSAGSVISVHLPEKASVKYEYLAAVTKLLAAITQLKILLLGEDLQEADSEAVQKKIKKFLRQRPVNIRLCSALILKNALDLVDVLSALTQKFLWRLWEADILTPDPDLYGAGQDLSTHGRSPSRLASARVAWSDRAITAIHQSERLHSKLCSPVELTFIEAALAFLRSMSLGSVPYGDSERLTLEEQVQQKVEQTPAVLQDHHTPRSQSSEASHPSSSQMTAAVDGAISDSSEEEDDQWSQIIDQLSRTNDQRSQFIDQLSRTNDQQSYLNGQQSPMIDQQSYLNGQQSPMIDQQSQSSDELSYGSHTQTVQTNRNQSNRLTMDGPVDAETATERLQKRVRHRQMKLEELGASLQRWLRKSLYESGLVEAIGPWLLYPQPSIQDVVLEILRNMVTLVKDDPSKASSGKRPSTSMMRPYQQARGLSTPNLVSLHRMSSHVREFMEETLRALSSPTHSHAPLRTQVASATPRAMTSLGVTNEHYDKYARRSSHSRPTSSNSVRATASRKQTTIRRTPQNSATPKRTGHQVNKVAENTSSGSCKGKHSKPTLSERPVEEDTRRSPDIKDSDHVTLDIPLLDITPEPMLDFVASDVLPMNVLGPMITYTDRSEDGHNCVESSRAASSARPGSAITAFPVPHSQRLWVPWKPDYDPDLSVVEQCRCLVAAVTGQVLLQRLFSKDLNQRKYVLTIVQQYMQNAQFDARIHLSQAGIIQHMVDFLRVNDDNEILEIMGLAVVQTLIQSDSRLQQLFVQHGGVDLLTAMTSYCEGVLKNEVKDTLKVISTGSYHSNATNGASDVWQKISSEWQRQDEVDRVFRLYSNRR